MSHQRGGYGRGGGGGGRGASYNGQGLGRAQNRYDELNHNDAGNNNYWNGNRGRNGRGGGGGGSGGGRGAPNNTRGASNAPNANNNDLRSPRDRPPPRPNVGTFTEKKFNWMLDKDDPVHEKIKVPKDATEFIAFLLGSPDKLDTLNRLVSSEHGLKVLRESLSMDNAINFVKQSVIPLIKFLGDDDRMTLSSSRGLVALKMLRTIFEAPFLLTPLVDHVVTKRLDQEECIRVAWLVVQVIKGGEECALKAKANIDVKKLATALSTGDYPKAKTISDEMKNLLENVHGDKDKNQSTAVESVKASRSNKPGWRHGNDKQDFHEMSLYPTAEELTCQEVPFLPVTKSVFEEAKSVPSYLDWAFRLLREDVVRSVKEELNALLKPNPRVPASKKIANRLRARSLNVIQFSEISCHQRFGVGFKMFFQEPHQVSKWVQDAPHQIRVGGPAKVLQYKKDYWKERSNSLKQQAILAFVVNEHKLISLGIVNARDIDELAKSPPRIDVFFFDKSDAERVVLELGVQQDKLKAYQLSASFFAFEPILQRLKMLSSVPFKEEILEWSPSNAVTPPTYCNESFLRLVGNLESADPSTDLAQILGLSKTVVLDANQKDAVTKSLNNRVALIQGPPGTGKSYCGAIISKIIRDHSSEPILCVCYTNHALDQFLEDLMDFGLPSTDIVRIGGADKISDRVKPLTLLNLLKAQGTVDSRRVFGDLRRRMDVLEVDIRYYTGIIAQLNSTRNMNDLAPAFESDEIRDAFRLPQQHDEFRIVGADNRPLQQDYLWSRWLAGEDQGVLLRSRLSVRDTANLWSLSRDERLEKVKIWRKAVIEPTMEQLDKHITRYNEMSQELSEMNQDNEIALLKTKRVIGCTTTGAAKYATKLDAVNAGVLIMEEAGEILEAHVITSMAADCKHLIMIGDHKQLRPKLNDYDLSVECGGPYAFNKSLFERLATSKFPLVTLQLQHRMRPEIADLVRQITYPELRDADKVKTDRKNVVGLLKNVVFIHHEHDEGSDPDLTQDDAVDNLSKINAHEIKMVAKIAQYLLRQGYQGNQIVVLTPYLAQLHALKQALSKVCEVVLSEMDIAELSRFGLDPSQQLPSTAIKSQLPSIRVSTVDNYQGEESDIVIASLVRSNSEGNIGFVGQPERVNVLLSRAREGLIMLGNMKTFEKSKSTTARELWENLLSLLKKQDAIYSYFPARCTIHDKKMVLAKPEDFDKLSPDGGCDAPCGQLLSCGKHMCPKRCHRMPSDHSQITCTAEDEFFCSKQHSVYLPCRSNADINNSCKKCVTIKRKEDDEKKQAAERAKKEAARLAELAAKQKAVQEAEQKVKQVEQDMKFDLKKLNLDHQQRSLEVEAKRKEAESQEVLQEKRQKLQEEFDAKAKNSQNRKANSNGGAVAASAPPPPVENENKPPNQPSPPPVAAAPQNVPPNDNGGSDSSDMYADGNDTSDNQTDKNLTSFVRKSLHDQIQEITSQSSILTDIFGLNEEVVSDIFSCSNALPVNLKRGIELTCEKDWMGAVKYFDKLDVASSPDRTPLSLLCRSQLNDGSLQADLANWEQSHNFAACDGHPLIFAFVSFVVHEKQANRAYGFGLAFLSQARKLDKTSTVPKEWLEMTAALMEKMRKTAFQTAPSKPPDLADIVKSRWEDEKTRYKGVKNEGMEKLLKLSALGKIKDTFWNVYQAVGLAKRQGRSLKEKRLNICLCGNPGTGKTTVARIYATFLADLDALSGSCFVETTGAQLVHEGVDGLKKLLAQIDADGGGLLFIDEAYQLNPQSEITGRHVMDHLLTEVENNIGKLVVAFAGYQNKIEKLMEYNEGLPSRFPYSFIFEDYSDEQLLEIFKETVKSSDGLEPFKVEGGLGGKSVKILMARIGRGRGFVGFGNARAVKNEFQRVLERQATRIAAERTAGQTVDDFLITREDLLGPDPVDALANSKAWAELKEMIGLNSVKSSVQQLMDLVKTNFEREKLGEPLLNVTLNRVFLGNPGTGKTTVAQIYGRILRDLGLLSSGEVMLKKPADFIGSALGQSDANTKSILQASLGKVLVIDEAYGLYSQGTNDPYKTAVIDTIVGEVQNVPGDDRCVLMLGYRKEMETMMSNSNPGLARRFSIENAFEFEDYNDVELIQILNLKLKKRGLNCSYQAQLCAADVLAKARRRPNFGNGGSVENCIAMAIQRMQERLKDRSPAERATIKTLDPSDFDPDWTPAFGGAQLDVNVNDIFKDLVNCDNIVALMNQYKTVAKVSIARGRDPCQDIPMNFLFQGPPGTGKTTVARRVGQMFKALGMIGSDEVVETSATDLIGQFVGQTAPKTRKKLEEALGRVLFIDEAYRLDPKKAGGQFCQEALDELVDLLTKPEFFGKLVVVLAGYKDDITSLLTANAGLASRFPGRIEFQSFSKEECVRLFKKKLDQEGWQVDDSSNRWQIFGLFDRLRQTRGWGNGRDIGNIVKKVIQKASNSVDPSKISAGSVIAIPLKVVVDILEDELKERQQQQAIMDRKDRGFAQRLLSGLELASAAAQSQNAPPPPPMEIQKKIEENKGDDDEEKEAKPESETQDLPEGMGPRDDGVSDAIWSQLLEAARREALERQELENKMRELEELARQRAEAERQAEIARKKAEELARQKREEEARKAREEAERKEAELRRIEEERRRREAEAQRLREEQQKRMEMQVKLRMLGLCPAGFQWYDVGGGFRCGGGSHYASYDEIQRYMH